MMSSYEFRKQAREALKGKWSLAVITGIIAALLGGFGEAGLNLNINLPSEYSAYYPYAIMRFMGVLGIASFFSLIIYVIIGGVTEIGYKNFNLKLIRGENPQLENLFDYFKYIKKGVSMVLLRGIFIFLQLLLFFIPGIIAIYRYALMPYILADDPDMAVMDAMEQSKKMMLGNKMKLFHLHITFIGWILLSALTCGIGFLWVRPYMKAAEALFYENVKFSFINSSSKSSDYNKTDFDHINWNE